MCTFSLSVQIEINGVFVKAGTLSGSSSADAQFFYDSTYLSNPESHPISISLPLGDLPFSPEVTKSYFEGLLPEGFTRKSIAESLHIDSEDYISILKELGKECLGAIQIIDEAEHSIEAGYKELSKSDVKNLASEGSSQAATLIIESHLSLTGASGKTGLYYDAKMDKWYQPLGTAPSNYIVKQSHVRLRNIVVNEQLCLLTAKKLGIEIPESFIIKTEEHKNDDADILFATKRFDRYTDDFSKKLDNLIIPYRLHQEDFAQALGIKAGFKYEKKGEHYLKRMFELLRSYSANPIEDQLKLWRICIFNYLVGNTDNHIKNFSLLYSKDLRTVRLAPCYDVISTKVYKNDLKEMSLSINGQLNRNEITREDFLAEAKLISLGAKIAMNIFDEVQDNFETALLDSVKELEVIGFIDAGNIASKILEK